MLVNRESVAATGGAAGEGGEPVWWLSVGRRVSVVHRQKPTGGRDAGECRWDTGPRWTIGGRSPGGCVPDCRWDGLYKKGSYRGEGQIRLEHYNERSER